MIHVIATIELVPGKREAFLREFHQIVAPVRAEKGCLEYGPTIDAETPIGSQGPRRENVVVVVEKWESIPALEAHLKAPHMEAYRPKVRDMVQKVDLQILKPV